MHPRKLITESYPNISAQKRLTNLVALSKEVKLVNQNETECVAFAHNPPPKETHHFMKRWVCVVQEGRPIHIVYPDPSNIVLGEVATNGNLK